MARIRPGSGRRAQRAWRAAGYVGYMQTGTASWIEPFTPEQFDAWTESHGEFAVPGHEARCDQPLPQHRARHLHRRENRTYDQVLGDMKEGNGDPVAGAVRRAGHSEPAQTGARVRAARQLLRQRRRERGRPQLVDRGDLARLRGEDVAEPICQPPQAVDFEDRIRSPCRPQATSGRTRHRPASRSGTLATWSTNKASCADRRGTDRRCATRCWPR